MKYSSSEGKNMQSYFHRNEENKTNSYRMLEALFLLPEFLKLELIIESK